MTLTDEELGAIESRANAASKGPWEHGRSMFENGILVHEEWVWKGTGQAIGDPDAPDAMILSALPEDAAFIAHARTDVPRLLDDVRHYRELLEAYRVNLKLFYQDQVKMSPAHRRVFYDMFLRPEDGCMRDEREQVNWEEKHDEVAVESERTLNDGSRPWRIGKW